MASYDFKHTPCDAQYLIPILNILGDNLIGLELGVGKGFSTLSMVANCQNIKKLYAIDSFKPYKDMLKNPYDGTPAFDVKEADVEFDKLTLYHNIKYSGLTERINVIESDKDEVLDGFEDEGLDFIFLDAHHTFDDIENDLEKWYPKLKIGGVFAIHDTQNEMVLHAIEKFREKYKITNHKSDYRNTFLWIKDE